MRDVGVLDQIILKDASLMYLTASLMLQTASTTPMHLNILTGFQLRLREALRYVSTISNTPASLT